MTKPKGLAMRVVVRFTASMVFLIALNVFALAQSNPDLVYGQVPTAGQWNSYFASKQDALGFIPCNPAGCVFTGELVTTPSTGASAGFNLAPGVSPAAPKNGDLWTTSLGLFARVGGVTVGPIGAGTPTSAALPLFVSAGVISINVGTGLGVGSGNLNLQAATGSTIGGVLVGTSGHAVPFLDGTNTWAAQQSFSVYPLVLGAPTALHVANNTALSTLVGTTQTVVHRDGFAAAGDGGAADYTWSASACSPAADNGARVQGPGGSCYISSGRYLDLLQFGITSGVDNSAAINAWLANAGPNVTLRAPCGNYTYALPVVGPTVNSGSLIGDGPPSCVSFTYFGSNTTDDMFTLGDGVTNLTGWYISNIRVASTTQMTDGYALRLKRLSDSRVRDIVADGQDLGNKFLWDGIYFDGVHEVFVDGIEAYTQSDGISATGNDASSNVDLYLHHCYSNSNGNAGLHIGGGLGGLFVDQCEFLGNSQANALVDHELVAVGNRELIFGPAVVLDGLQTASQYGLVLNDSLASGGQVAFNGFEGSAVLDGIFVENWPSGAISIGSNRIYNNLRDGIRIADVSSHVQIGSQAIISNNGGWGINSLSQTVNIMFNGATYSNTTGDFSPNSNVGWQTFVETPTATTGAFTAAAANVRVNRVSQHFLAVEITITITTNGSAGGAVEVTIPYTVANSASSLVGHQSSAGGAFTCIAQSFVGNGNIVITQYDNGYPGADGATITVSGYVEI